MGRTDTGARRFVLAGLFSTLALFTGAAGNVTASVFEDPPDLEQHVEDLHPLGEEYSFELKVPGQRAVLSLDLIPGTRLLFQFSGNTVAAGCAEPLGAALEGPNGRVWSNLSLCTGHETITFRAATDGYHYLTLDPAGERTGAIVVTVFLDEPSVDTEGPFFEDLVFSNGSRSYGFSVSAAYPRGIARVWVRQARGATVVSSTACRTGCPTVREIRGTIDTRRLGEGTQTFHIGAVGTDGRSSDVEQHQIWIDRTPPRPPSKFRVETFDPQRRTAVVVWREGEDPDGPHGARPAGTVGHDCRLRRNGNWGPWRSVEAASIEVAGVRPGSVLGLQVRGNDGARNSSRLVEARLRVTGREPRPEPE